MPISSDDLRNTLRVWMTANHWTVGNVSRALHSLGRPFTPSITTITAYLAGKSEMEAQNRDTVQRFLVAYPSPGSFDDFSTAMTNDIFEASRRRDREISERREAVERERAERRRALLAMEHRPKRAERSLLYGLDKATILALSGGVL